MSSALGYKAIVHMSADAMQWKKDLLRKHGAEVIEYSTDYTEAVRQGRKLSDEDPSSYFVDDENSLNLFLGYACAALRLREQLQDKDIQVDGDHPLFVYIPCGVGGAPGGISYGLKQVYGDSVHCFFVEPVTVPCMLIGLESGLNEKISVYDLGLSGQSQADGLAVGRPSGFVGKVMTPYLSGEFTIKDSRLFDYLQDITRSENIFLEPSACAGFHGPLLLNTTSEGQKYLSDNGLTVIMKNSTHIVWATGGNLVPHDIRDAYLKTDSVDD